MQSTCNVCLEQDDKSKCPKCQIGMCHDCQLSYFESCLQEENIPVCINPECDFQFTTSLFKERHIKHLVPKLLIATKKSIQIGDNVLTYVEIERKLQKIRQDIDERNRKLLSILPINLQKITSIISKSSNQSFMKRARSKLVKDSKVGEFRECPKMSCNGFINLITRKCSVCEQSICEKCQEIKEDEHQCKKEDLESVHFIKYDTQLCPTCRISIYRSEGCDHMYCVNCKTHFSYSTGERHGYDDFAHPEAKTTINMKLVHRVPELEKYIRNEAPSHLLSLFDNIYDLLSKLKSNNIESNQLKLHSGKITEEMYNKTLLKTYETDYLNRVNRKMLLEVGENILSYLSKRDYLSDLAPSWLTSYTNWRTTFNSLFKLGYKLP